MKVDLEKYREYIETRIAEGASLRMLENEIGIERQKLSREMKKAGMRVPTRIESVKFLWKNHKHPHIGKPVACARRTDARCQMKPNKS